MTHVRQYININKIISDMLIFHTVTRGRHINAARDITTTRLEPVTPATGSYILVALSYHCLAGCVVVL
jgi:hypothetical protein